MPSGNDSDRQRNWLSTSFLGAAVLSDTGRPTGRVDAVFLAPDKTIATISVSGNGNPVPEYVPLQAVRLLSDRGVG
jgi:hypothetical protein